MKDISQKFKITGGKKFVLKEFDTAYTADYKKESVRTNSYAIFFLTRFTFYGFIVVIMRDYVFFQMVLMEYINLIFILYILIDHPFESKLKFVFALILELFVVYLLGYPLLIVYYDMQGKLYPNLESSLGDNFVTSYCVFSILIICMTFIGILKTIYDKVQLKKKEKEKLKQGMEQGMDPIKEVLKESEGGLKETDIPQDMIKSVPLENEEEEKEKEDRIEENDLKN